MACGWTPDLLRMLESVGDEKQKLAQEAEADLTRTKQQIESLKKKAAARVTDTDEATLTNTTRDWTAVYEKWDAYEDPEELAQREQEARDKQARASRAAAAAGCNHDHSAEQKLMDMSTREKLDACNAFRVLGNRFFAQGQYQRAAYHYHKALVYFEYVFPESPDEDDEMVKLQLTTRLNFAACRLKTGHLDDAIHHADLVLEGDPQNVKALYRRAQAYRLRDEFEHAMTDITLAIATQHQDVVDPMLVQEKQLLQAKMLAYKRKSKLLSVAMFGGATTGSPSKETTVTPWRGGVSSVKDVPLHLSTASVVGGQDNQTAWRLDESWRPSTAGLTDLQHWLDAL